MKDETLLSVIIPAYNAEKYLKEAVDSVKAQNWKGLREIIVVDDGSSDNTAALANLLGCRVISVRNGGAAAARNTGIRNSDGELIFFLDADDVLMPGALTELFAPMQADASLKAAFGTYIEFISPELTADQAAGLKVTETSAKGILPGCAIIKRELFENIGLFDQTLRSGETVDWMMRLRESKEPFLQTEVLTLKRRLHMTNTGRLDPKGEMKSYAALLRKRMKKK